MFLWVTSWPVDVGPSQFSQGFLPRLPWRVSEHHHLSGAGVFTLLCQSTEREGAAWWDSRIGQCCSRGPKSSKKLAWCSPLVPLSLSMPLQFAYHPGVKVDASIICCMGTFLTWSPSGALWGSCFVASPVHLTPSSHRCSEGRWRRMAWTSI